MHACNYWEMGGAHKQGVFVVVAVVFLIINVLSYFVFCFWPWMALMLQLIQLLDVSKQIMFMCDVFFVFACVEGTLCLEHSICAGF